MFCSSDERTLLLIQYLVTSMAHERFSVAECTILRSVILVGVSLVIAGNTTRASREEPSEGCSHLTSVD